jgi:type III restriction enzyme
MSKKTLEKEHFAKHPLAQRIMKEVERWSENGYTTPDGKSITPITKELLEYWFNPDIHDEIRFHLSQKRAIESAIYCYEILDAPTPGELFDIFNGGDLGGEGLEKELEKMAFPRFAIKMATGTGKTWVINALIVWQYFNSLKHNDGRFSPYFLIVAPGNIVYERLLDSFLGKVKSGKRDKLSADLENDLFMPESLRQEFDLRIYTKDDITGSTGSTENPFIMITNWHQLVDAAGREKTISEDLGIEFTEDRDSYRVQNFYDFLTANNSLIVINDEAHHLLNASDRELKRWQEAVEKLYINIKEKKGTTFVQYDFTATPYTITGKKKEWMKHVIYDYGLVEAMNDMLVKQIFIEKSSYLSEKIEKLSENEKFSVTAHKDETRKILALSDVQKHMLQVGYEKLQQLEDDFKNLNIHKKPIMFIVAGDNDEADELSAYLQQRMGDNDGNQLLTIHSDKKNSLSEDEYRDLKEKVFASDVYESKVRAIVSVMMLKEGFDVRNVCVLVVLRPSDSDLLVEQLIGRGIRLMFTEDEYKEPKMQNMQLLRKNAPLINSYDFLFIVEHPKYNQIYVELKKAGALLSSGESRSIALDSKRILVKIDETRVPEFDIYWPASYRDTVKEELNFSYFRVNELQSCPISFEQLEPKSIIITDFHPQTKFMQDWNMEEKDFSYTSFLRNVTLEIIGSSRNMNWVTRYFDEIARISDDYVSEFLFRRRIDFNVDENAVKLRNFQLLEFIVTNLRREITRFISSKRAVSLTVVDWVSLSMYPELKVTIERSLITRKCVYPYLDFGPRGGFEKRFAEFVLEKDSGVIAYVKLDQYIHRFSIAYLDNKGFIGRYYPDFLVRTNDEMFIVETKSEKDAYNDLDVKFKMIAAQQFCISVSKASNHPRDQPKNWRYILLPENIADEYEGHSFKSIVERAESFMSNLTWSIR